MELLPIQSRLTLEDEVLHKPRLSNRTSRAYRVVTPTGNFRLFSCQKWVVAPIPDACRQLWRRFCCEFCLRVGLLSWWVWQPDKHGTSFNCRSTPCVRLFFRFASRARSYAEFPG